MSDAQLLLLLFLLLLLAGPHLPALDRSDLRRTSTGEIRRAVGLAGLQPDLNQTNKAISNARKNAR